LRFFLLPGVGHCGGSEGPNQLDTLGPLMAWVETHQAPQRLGPDNQKFYRAENDELIATPR
jgi:hypothetical protein